VAAGEVGAMIKILIISFLFFFGTLGCTSVQPSQIIGTWIITDESRKAQPAEVQKALGKIIVKKDGTFIAYEIPENMFTVPPYHKTMQIRLNSGNGSWKLASWEGALHLELEFSVLPPAYGISRGPYRFPLTITRGWSAISLYYYLGDPDVDHMIEFEKK
jgi:hypothetical protein